MNTIPDAIWDKLSVAYGLNKTNADNLRQHWIDKGLSEHGPGIGLYEWFKSQLAVGTTVLDAELDYWLNRYGAAAANFLVDETGNFIIDNAGNFITV
jgi:hypothetical protein